ncbi:hypothetical protein PR202_gb12201 [Eleusine coracana subsp. coracana]|uniref:BPM/SPOP BACK domain-containing protein n=1 Tax=Eleusine coracana subsp. coracana TaxID=191504 RepID=A0AAV5EPF8_ELECO|nr:hypothetical protein PR202_gb12201 [Eleusine coracana subsp. coracana]
MLLSSGEEGPVLAEDLLVAADRYNLKDLKKMIEKLMCKNISVRTALPLLVLAEQHQCRRLKRKCLGFIASRVNTSATMETDDVEQLARCCPSVVKEVITKVLEAREEERTELIIGMFVFAFLFLVIVVIFVWLCRLLFRIVLG